MHHPTDRITHTPAVEHWLEREIAQWVHHEGSIWRSIAPWANALTTELHFAPVLVKCYKKARRLTYLWKRIPFPACSPCWLVLSDPQCRLKEKSPFCLDKHWCPHHSSYLKTEKRGVGEGENILWKPIINIHNLIFICFNGLKILMSLNLE